MYVRWLRGHVNFELAIEYFRKNDKNRKTRLDCSLGLQVLYIECFRQKEAENLFALSLIKANKFYTFLILCQGAKILKIVVV